MRIVFMGTPYFAAVVLRAMAHGGYAPSLVVSQPDKPKGRGRRLCPTPVHEAANELGLPITQPPKLDEAAFRAITEVKPDVIAVAAYGKFLKKNLLDLPPLGCINAHASLLPKYRGAAPINWAIIHGEKIAGVTIMKMDEGMDSGPTSLRSEVPISNEDTAETLTQKMADAAASLMVEAMQKLELGEVRFEPQDHAAATLAPMLTKKDGVIDWTRPAEDIDRLIRGVTPWPGAQTTLRGKRLKIVKARAVSDVGAEPGVIARADADGLLVGAGTGSLQLLEVQLEGKKCMDVGCFLCGMPINSGQVLGD
jgi:methionyl-tRNA formyltransferase